jgi:hypothetical protein
MKIKNGDLQVLVNAMITYGDMLNVKEAYWLTKDIKKIQKELTIIEDMRQSLIKKYGTTDKDGQVKLKDDVKFLKDFYTILGEEVELDIKPININKLEDLKLANKGITTVLLTALSPIIVE